MTVGASDFIVQKMKILQMRNEDECTFQKIFIERFYYDDKQISLSTLSEVLRAYDEIFI